MQRILKAIENFIGQNRGGIVLIMLLIAVTGSIVGYRYYRYTRDTPEFCLTCHMMQDTFISWQKSKHWQIKCQTCHKMSIFEQNRLVVAYITKGATGPQKQMHGRAAPWQACRKCHLEQMQQGSAMRRSYGHARHVFMENIGCDKCHSGTSHNFTPNEAACAKCHKDKLVHGLGMEGLSCLKCHNYGTGKGAVAMVSEERCMGCHRNVRNTGAMAALKCFDCHKPHGKIKLTSADCLARCHGN